MLHNTSWNANSITLMWDSPADAGRTFEVYSDSASDGSFSKLVYAGTENFCEVKQLVTGEQRFYRMRWTIDGTPSDWSNVCSATPSTNPLTSVYFANYGDAVAMAYVGSATATYHWSDGTTSSGGSKSGLGTGIHVHYVTFDTPSAITEFGNPSTTVYAIDGLNYLTGLNLIMVYDNAHCRRFGHTNLCTSLRNYHIASSGLTNDHMDMQYVDMVTIGQTPGDWYSPNATGTVASYTERMALRAAGWNDIPSSPVPAAIQNVTYDGNEADGGAVPTDSTDYAYRDAVTVSDNTGALTRTGYTFAGWNTAANGTGLFYEASDTFAILQNTTLYAVWEVSAAQTWNVTYDGNNSDGGSVPVDGTNYADGATVTPVGNTGNLTRSGYTFNGWALSAGGPPVESFSITADTVLYAVWVEVVPATTLVFTTSGDTFAPRIEVSGAPEILWTFSDNSTSNSITPSVSFGSTGTREHTLIVTPWSALVGINLGYGAEDGGSESIPIHPAQSVTALDGLGYVQDTLEYICGSGTAITSINITGFTSLHTVEFYQGSLTSFNPSGCTALRRLCLESCSIPTLDLTGLAALEDLRYADNNSTGLTLPTTAPNLWHICVRDNPNMGLTNTFNFPALRDLWAWNSGISGELVVVSGNLQAPFVYDNNITSADFSGSTLTSGYIWISGNPSLTEIILPNGALFHTLDARNCSLTTESINTLLSAAVATNLNDGTIQLTGVNNSNPSSSSSINTLTARGWTVETNAVVQVYHLTDVTRDNSGSVIGGCQVSLFRHEGSGVYSFVATQVSDEATGVYDFGNLLNNDPAYFITARRVGSPNIYDCTDSNLQPIAVQ